MFNLAWTEILLIIIVAVVVIGPTQLPGAIRGMADGIKKAKRQLAAFQQQADELVREAKLEGVRDQIADVKGAINEIRSFDLKGHIQKAVDEDGTLTRTFNEDPLSGSTTTSTPAWTPPPTARDTPDAPAMIPPQTMAPYKPPPEPPKPEVPAFLPPSTPAPLNMTPSSPPPTPVVAPAAEDAPAEIPPAEVPRIDTAATEAPAPAPVPAKTA